MIFTLRDAALQVLLIERGLEPFRGRWALPGGFVQIKEDLEDVALCELREGETGLTQGYLDQIGAFAAPDRDPRELVVSITYFAIIAADKMAVQARRDARRLRWCPWKLPSLPFDHRHILDAARRKLLEQMNRTTIALHFLSSEFTLTELQGVFETVQGTPMDKRNLRKWAESLSFIKPTGKTRRGGSIDRPRSTGRTTKPCSLRRQLRWCPQPTRNAPPM